MAPGFAARCTGHTIEKEECGEHRLKSVPPGSGRQGPGGSDGGPSARLKSCAYTIRTARLRPLSVSLLQRGYLILAMRAVVGYFWNWAASWPGMTRSGLPPASSIIRD